MRMRVRAENRVRVRALEDVVRMTPEAANAVVETVDYWFRKHELSLFASQGGIVQSWKPLSAAYKKWKAKKRPGRKILVFDGDMRRSLVWAKNPEHVAQASKIDKERWVARWGTTNQVATYHFEGLPPLPRRDPVAHRREDWMLYIRKMGSALVPHVVRATKAYARLTGAARRG